MKYLTPWRSEYDSQRPGRELSRPRSPGLNKSCLTPPDSCSTAASHRPSPAGGCGIRAKINTLKTSPHRCPVDPDSAAYGTEVRVLLYGKRQGVYRVLFTIRGDAVFVLTVRHSAQRRLTDDVDQGDEEDPPH